MEVQRTQNSQNYFEKEQQIYIELTLPNSKTYYKTAIINTV